MRCRAAGACGEILFFRVGGGFLGVRLSRPFGVRGAEWFFLALIEKNILKLKPTPNKFGVGLFAFEEKKGILLLTTLPMRSR